MNVNRENNIFALWYVKTLIFLCLIICPCLSALAEPIKITNSQIFKIKGVQNLSGMVMKNTNAFVIAGSTNAAFMLSRQGVTRGNVDYHVFETNRSHKIQWEQIYGSRHTDRISSIVKHADNLILAGTTWDLGSKKMVIAGMESDTPLGSSTRIINTNLNGDVKWDKTYPNVKGYSFSHDQMLVVKASGGYAVASQIINDDTYRKDIRIFTVARNGNMEWDRKWTTDKDKTIVGIVQSDDRGYVLTGDLDEGIGFDSTWVMKLSSNGQLVWNQTIDSGKRYYNSVTPGHLIKTTGGNYLIAGRYRDDTKEVALVTMMDDSGRVKWKRRYSVGDYTYATCVAETKDGGFILGGMSPKKGQRRIKQPWLVRTDYRGNEIWQVTMVAERSATINNILIINSKQFAIAGEINEVAGAGVAPNTDIWFMVLQEN